MEKLIIAVAPTGNVPTKKMNSNTPVTVREIVDNIKQCSDIGASIAHIHVRDENQKPTSDRAIFKEILDLMDQEKVGIIRQISNAKYLMKKGILKGPLHFNLVLNVRGSIEGTPKNLMYMVDSLPEGSSWTVTAIGRCHVQLITMAIVMGGHVRTGLEDIVEYERGIPASNAMLVERVVKIANAVGRPVATPQDVREMLSLL